jgi:tetratricopeptide (TPR) repeat protein
LRSLLCIALLATAAHADTFEDGLAKFQAEDFAGAVPLLEQAHAATPSDADIALLLGIAYYRTDARDRAKPLLEQAERDGDEESKASARIFLGLLAEDAGQDERANVYYEQVARVSPELGASARLLIDQAGPARWLVVGVMRPEVDSNVALLPMTSGRGHNKGSADGELDLVLAVSARPIDAVPLVVDQTLSYDKHATMTEYDMLADRVGATYTVTRQRNRGSLAYHFEASRLGGERYQLGHVVDIAGRRRLGDALALGGRYTFAARDYGGSYSDYSGLSHTGLVQIVRGTRSQPLELAGGYEVQRDGSSVTMFAHGPRGDVRWRMWKRGELRASIVVQDRIYDRQRDLFAWAQAALYVDVSSTFGLVTGASGTLNASDSKQSGYTKYTAFAGVIVVMSD